MGKDNINDDVLRQLVKSIECIPSHREPPTTLASCVNTVSSESSLEESTTLGLCQAAVAFLSLFGIIQWRNDSSFHIGGQVQEYFRQSLLWYLKNGQEIFGDWTRPGVARDISAVSVLDTAPYFVKALEQRRLEISKRNSLEPGFSRTQPVSILLIRADINDEPHFLHQWDMRAEQFQPIGGRQRENQSELETAMRELDEEIVNHQLVNGRDYVLQPINEQPVVRLDISRTYGALTLYKYWFFSVSFKMDVLKLSDQDRWLSLSEMRQGVTKKGRSIASSDRIPQFESAISGGLAAVPISIKVTRTADYLKYVELKPQFFGLSVDLKQFVIDRFRKRRK